MTITTLISNLTSRYNSFINLPEREFFLGIANYVKYFDEIPELGNIKHRVRPF